MFIWKYFVIRVSFREKSVNRKDKKYEVWLVRIKHEDGVHSC